MTTLALLFAISAVFAVLATVRAKQLHSDAPLQMLVLVNMMLITLFGSAIFEVGPLRSNCGNVWYANVVLIQFIIMERFGWAHGLRCVSKVFAGLVLLLLTVFVVSDPLGPEYERVVSGVITFAFASFVAFWLGQMTLIAAYRQWASRSLRWRYLAAMCAAQVVDSLVFFPLAFGADATGVMISGALVKMALGALALPFLRSQT